MTRSRTEMIRTLALLGVAVLLRALGALVRPGWHDEYFTAWAASLPFHDLLGALALDSGPPLPYVAAKLLALLGVPALGAARLLAVAAGSAAVVLGTRAAAASFGERAGWWCGVMLAVHPLAVAWACEGRAYAWLMLAAAWAWERLAAIARTHRGWLGLGLAVAVGCWSHAFGLILAAMLAVCAFALPPPPRRKVLLAIAAGIASNLPWIPTAAAQPNAATAWISHAFAALAPLERFLAPVRLLPPLAPFGQQLDLPSAPAALQIAAALLCLILLAAAPRSLAPLLLLLLPVASLTVLAWLGLPALYPGRGEALYLLPFLALLAAGVGRHPARRVAGALLAVGGGALVGLAIVNWAHAPASQEERLAAALRREMPEGGTVAIGGYWRLGLAYHLGDAASRYRFESYPATAAHHPGWYDDAERPAPGELDRLAAWLSGEVRASRPVAVVVAPGYSTAADLTRLSRELGLRAVLASPVAALWTPPAAAGARR